MTRRKLMQGQFLSNVSEEIWLSCQLFLMFVLAHQQKSKTRMYRHVDKYKILFVRHDFTDILRVGLWMENNRERGKRLMVTIHKYFVFLMSENSAV